MSEKENEKEDKQLNEAQMSIEKKQANKTWDPFQIGISILNKEHFEVLDRDIATIIDVIGPSTNEVKLMRLLFMHDLRNQSF